MLELVFLIISLFITGIAGYYGVCHIIKLWTGCNSHEAGTKLHNFINGKFPIQFNNDIGFSNDVWENVKNIIGDKRYEQLVKLSQTAIETPLLSFGENSGLPYISISLYYKDQNEKCLIENVLSNLVVKYLRIYGFNTQILVDWKVRYDLKMPFLEIRYARTPEEQNILTFCQRNTQQSIMAKNSAIIDDTEEDDLDE